MKIDRKKIFNRCGFDQRECYDLAVRLAALNEEDLIQEIKKINVWHYGKCELGLWADVLDRLDTILAEGVTRVGHWTLKLDEIGNEHLIGKIIAILEFTGHLIEHSIYRYLYGSWEHILSLFGTSNMDILHALLGLFYNFSKRSNYFSRLDSTNRKIVLERLDSIAENWGGKQHGFGLAECCDTEYMPYSAGTMQYEFMQDVSPASVKEESSTQSSTQEVFIKPKCHRRKLTLRNLHLQPESPSELMENLIQKYNLTSTSDQMALFARLRLCVYFGKPEQRKLLIFTRMQALSILCYTNEVEDKCLSWDIVEELVDVLKLPNREFLGIKACALRTLTAIIHCGKLASCWPVLKNMTGMNSYHGHFPTMMREWISDLVQARFQPFASTVEQMYTTAILSFLYHLACTNEVTSTNQGNLIGTGLLESMKEIIMWHTHEPDYISFATRAVRVTDQILLSFQLNGNSTNQKSTIDAIVDRLKFEIEICLQSEIDETTRKSVALNTQRVGFIKSMLNLIKRLILDNEWSDTLQTTMDGELPDTLRLIFMNYTSKFNPQLCLFSMEVITNFVYNHPSSMSAMQERYLTRDILRTLTEQPLPVNRDFLVTLPTLLSALSINVRGINEIKDSRIIDKYIRTLTDSRFVTAMRNKRIREMMTPSDSADTATNNHSHPSTPTSYQMSNAMNELARANAVVFKPIIYDAISKAFKTVTLLGQKQPAPLLASGSKPSGMQKVIIHRNSGHSTASTLDDNDLSQQQQRHRQRQQQQQQQSRSSQDLAGTSGVMFSNDNSQADLLAVMNAVEEADREVEQIMEMSGDEDDGVADNEMTQAIDADEDRTPSDGYGGSGKEHSKAEEMARYSCDDDAVYLMDYICNVCKFMERFLSDQQPEQSLRHQIYSEEGLKTILDILTIPSLPYDFPSSPACQSMQKIFEYLLSWATATDAILIYKMFFKISTKIGERLQRLEQPKIYSILLKDYVNRSESLQDPAAITTTVINIYWEENGVCLLHDLVILSTVVVIYDKITDRLSTNLRQDILVELKNGIIDYARLLPLLNWEAMVLMNLLFEDEEACLEDLKRLCINERGSSLDNDRCEEGCFLGKKSSLSTCQQLFSDNPRSEKIIKRMLQITQKAANDMVELLVTLTKFCCVKPDYSYVVRVRYNRVNGSIPTGKNKLALLNKIAEHCKSLLERESPYTLQASQDSWPEDPHSELPVDKACQKILSDIKFLHPMKYFCFTTIHRILTGGDLQKKPFLGFFYAFQMNNGLEVFFECANELLDTIKYIQYLDPNTNSSVKIMLESFLITVDRMTQIRRITQEFLDSTDKELKDRFDIDLYQRMIRAYMLEPISKLFSFSSLDIDLLNNQSQESLMNIIAFLTSYIFDRDSKKTEPEEATEESIVAFNDEHEQMISHHIDFIMELGFSRESARRALERNDYDPTQAVSSLFNADLNSIRMTESSSTIPETENTKAPPIKLTENSREISAIEIRLKELETKNASIKEMIKESFLINLFNLQKEKGIDIITRIVDILLLTGQINEFLEKILAINGCRFLTSDDSYSNVLKSLILTHSGNEISGANIEDSPNGLHILTLLYNKIRFQVTSSFKNHDMVTRLVKMTNLLFKSFMATSAQTETFKTSILKHITQLWLILDQYERTAFALRIRKDVIYEYQGCPTWFWIDDRHGIWHPVSSQHNININRSYRNGQLKAYSKPNSNNEYVFNFVSLTQKNEESQTERPIMLLPIKSENQRKPDTLSEYESKIISCVPDPLGDEEVVELSDNMLQFLISIKKIDNVYKWDCLQAACYLLIRLCDRYNVANERLAAYKSAIPRLCTIPHLKGYTQQLVTFVMTLLRQQFETPQLLRHTISDILDKNIPKGACVLHKTTSFNEKLSKDMFYFIWDNIPLLVRDFDTTMDLMTKKIELHFSNKEQLLKAYTISKSASTKIIQPVIELEKKQIAIVRFLVESALSFYIEKNDVWCELFKKLKLNTEHDLKTLITSPNHLLETHTVVVSNLENNFSANQQSGNVKHTYKLNGKEFLIYLCELIFSYEQVGTYTINLRLFNRPISFYLVNIYLQEACALLDSIRSKDPGSSTSPSLSREQTQFQQLVSLQIIEAFLLTVKESYDLIISEIVRNLKTRSHHKDGDCRNTYIVVIMKLLNDLITRLPIAVSKKLVILMYKYRLPNDLCRLLSVVDCSVVQHKSVLVDILTVIDSLCRPDRQMYINKRQRSSKSNMDLLNKRQRRINNTADSQISSTIPGATAAANEITSQEMETDDVFYVDINAWSRNSRTENTDNATVDNLENLDSSNTDEHPVDVDDDEEMDDYDEVDGVMMSEFRDIDAEYDFDEPQMYDDDNNTESETDYEEIEEDEGSAGSQDGDSQGDRFDEDIRDTENTTHRSGTQEQSRRIFQILNHNYYNINQDSDNPEVPRHDPESLRDRLNNVLMTSTYDHQPSYLLNEGFSLDAPTAQEDTNTFRLADNLYFVTNSREYDVSNQPSNYYPNDLAGCANNATNNLIRTSSLESPATSQNPPVQTGSQEDSVNGRGWRGLTYAPGARYMRLEARTLRQNTIRNILTLNRGSFMDRAPNARSPSNRFVDADLSLDSLEGDFEMQDILGRALGNIPSGWSFLINQSSSTPPGAINNFTFADISMITNFRRWLVEARTLYGREITDLVMLARARVYQAVLSKLPEVTSTEDKISSLKTNIEKMVDNIIEGTHNSDRIGMIHSDISHDVSMEQDMMNQPEIMIENFGTSNETIIGEEMTTPTPSETMETTRDEPAIDNIDLDNSDEPLTRIMPTGGATGGVPAPVNDDDIDHLSMEQLISEGIDPSFLEALPPSMRREVIIEHRRANRVRQQLTGVQLPENVDAEIMAQLPPHIQEEILAHYRRESTTGEANSSSIAGAVVSGGGAEANALTTIPAAASGVVDSSFLLSLAPGLRREILADMDQSQIANLSTELADEARQVRQETGDAQMRALQANLLSVTGRRRARQLTSGLSDLLSQMNRGRWDQRNIRYVVFSERGQTNRHNNPTTSDQVAESGEWPNLSAYKPLVSTDGLTNLIALLITSSTSPSIMKMISTLVNKILQSLTCHPQIRAWISCTIVNILLKISLPKEITEIKPKIFSSPSNSESSILCTPIGSGSCTDMSRSSSIQDDTFRQYPNNKSLFFHSFERGFALTDQVFVPSISKIYKHKNKSGIQSLEMPEVTIHESVSGSVAKALIDSLSTISSMHTKEFYPTSQSSKIPTNFWFTLAWYMSLKSVSLEDLCPETHLPPNEEYDYFTHLLCLVRLPLMQTNNAMLEKLLLTIHNILKAYYKSFTAKEKSMTEWSNNLQTATTVTDGDHSEPRQSTTAAAAAAANTTITTTSAISTNDNAAILLPIKEKAEATTSSSNSTTKTAIQGLADPHLNRVNVKTISHLVNIICAKECSSQTPLPTDKCRVLSERLLIELSKGNSNTKQDIIKLLTSNIESVLETLTGVLHKVLDEAVAILEKECNEAASSSDAGTSSSSASPLKKSSTFTDSMASDLLAASMSPSYDMAFTSASARRSQSQLSSSGYSRNNSLPHIAFNQLKMESIKPFTGSTGDHLNLLDLFNLLRKVDPCVLAQFQSPSPLWQLLSQVLDAIQRSREPDAVIVFQSLVESFLLCHQSHCAATSIEDSPQQQQSLLTTNNVAAVAKSDPLSHLNSLLVVDSFMSSPPASASSDTGKQSSPFVEFVEKHKKVLNHILRRRTACALDQSNFSSLLRYPKLLDFDIKRRYFQAKVAQLRNDGDSRYEEELVQVSRARLFEDSYGRLHRKSADEWKQRFCIKFANEEGQDGGGLLREWYLKMSHEIFNPNYALFRVSPDGVTYTINPASYVNNNHLSYFKFVGRFIAKAIFDNKLLTCYFTRAFYKHILGVAIRYTDLEKEDYQFFRGLEFLLKNDVSTMFLDQTFSIQISEFGQTETRDLLSNGSQILVSEENKAEYVRLVCQEKMTGAIRQQLHSFLEGFYEIIPKGLIAIFNEKELELLICGLPEIDLNDLKVNTVYNKYTPASPQIQWFWQVLESFDQEDRARFIQFVTGTSKVPLGGFSKLEGMNGPTKFQISLASMSTNHLPAAHTCFNSIDLPQYESYEKLHKCLLTAIRECSEGYGMI